MIAMRGRWTRSRAVVSTFEGEGAVVAEDVAAAGARLSSIGAIGSVMVSLYAGEWTSPKIDL